MRVFTRKHSLPLEVLEYHPKLPNDQPPLLFLHGANMTAWCWEAFFLPYFTGLGYTCYAVSLRGHGRSHGKSHMGIASIEDYVDDVSDAIDRMETAPILIGHSLGALIIMRYLEKNPLRAAVLLAPIPLGGTVPSVLNLAWTNPFLFAQLNLLQLAGKSLLPTSYWRELLFSSDVDPEIMNQFCAELQNESPRALLDAAWYGLPTINNPFQSKMLMIGAEKDVFFTPRQVKQTAEAFGSDYHQIDQAGHILMLERNWQECADYLSVWIQEASAQVDCAA